MYIKFLKHGKGDPAKAASYLVDDVDHEIRRPLPLLLNLFKTNGNIRVALLLGRKMMPPLMMKLTRY